VGPRPTRALVAVGILVGAALALGCPSPPPDLDGEPDGARALPLGRSWDDVLNCGRPQDCADWYRLRVPGPGTLTVQVRSSAGSRPSERPGDFGVRLQGEQGVVERGSSDGSREVELVSDVVGSVYHVEVRVLDSRSELAYEIETSFVAAPPPPPPPPAPRFETLQSAVLEVEGRGERPETVLLEKGSDDGVRPGLHGRLVDGELELGEIVVEQVYPEGSRARIVGVLAREVGPDTMAELIVPLDPGSSDPFPEAAPGRP
jgi:hypothetical protein